MKRLVCFLVCIIFSFTLFASELEVLSITKDSSRNLIMINYKTTQQDGTVAYGKYAVAPFNLYGKTEEEILSWAESNLNNINTNVTVNEFFKNNTNLAPLLSKLIGRKYTSSEAEAKIDTDKDGIVDITYTIKTDGTYVEKK